MLKNSTRLNHNKLYNCQQDIHQKRRVRSVVRISRRSAEPFMETISHTVKSNLKSSEMMDGNLTSNQQINTQKIIEMKIDWEGYRDYLTNLNKSKKEIQNKLGYGKTYFYV
jgi:hypothetical protein